MARRYCTIENIESLMPPDIFSIGSSLQDTIGEEEVNNLIEQATIDIDSQLGSFYEIPLRQVKLGDTTEIEYPPPIPFVCARKTMALLYDRYFASTAGSSDASNYVTALVEEAEKQFVMILNGQRRLLGQRLIRRRFCRQTLLETPYAPRGEGGAQP